MAIKKKETKAKEEKKEIKEVETNAIGEVKIDEGQFHKKA